MDDGVKVKIAPSTLDYCQGQQAKHSVELLSRKIKQLESLLFVTDKPVIYSCSGCSNLAQMANHIALEMTRLGHGEMSCIAGIGGNVPSLVKKAKQARNIIALDGCHLHCVKHCLANHDITPNQHITLTDYGFRKRPHVAFDTEDANTVLHELITETPCSH